MDSDSRKRLTISEESDRPAKRSASTSAAKLNKLTIKKLQRTLERDPECDLLSAFPFEYSERLNQGKEDIENEPLIDNGGLASSSIDAGTDVAPASVAPTTVSPTTVVPAAVVHSLSEDVKKIFKFYDKDLDFSNGTKLALALDQLLNDLVLIFDPLGTRKWFVGKYGSKIAVKAIRHATEFTEYTTLQYLQLHRPQLPVPRPHGLIVRGITTYIFQSLIPGSTLTQIWPSLDNSHKTSISKELDRILLDLRGLQLPEGTPLGGVANEGCKDVRRQARVSTRPLYSAAEFWEFQYSEARGSQIYRALMRELTEPLKATKCVFTHGDIRTDNILAVKQSDGSYQISGIVDWEMSGFYPEDFECTKLTNTFSPFEESDWYLYLPQCVSPARYISRWLADVVWDKQVV